MVKKNHGDYTNMIFYIQPKTGELEVNIPQTRGKHWISTMHH